MNRDAETPTTAGPNATSDSAPVRCPFCGSTETEEMGVFGSQLSTAQRYCRACHTPFERLTRAAGRTATATEDTPGEDAAGG